MFPQAASQAQTPASPAAKRTASWIWWTAAASVRSMPSGSKRSAKPSCKPATRGSAPAISAANRRPRGDSILARIPMGRVRPRSASRRARALAAVRTSPADSTLGRLSRSRRALTTAARSASKCGVVSPFARTIRILVDATNSGDCRAWPTRRRASALPFSRTASSRSKDKASAWLARAFGKSSGREPGTNSLLRMTGGLLAIGGLCRRLHQIEAISVTVEPGAQGVRRRQFLAGLEFDKSGGVEAAEVHFDLLEAALKIEQHQHAFAAIGRGAQERIIFIVGIGGHLTAAAGLLQGRMGALHAEQPLHLAVGLGLAGAQVVADKITEADLRREGQVRRLAPGGHDGILER